MEQITKKKKVDKKSHFPTKEELKARLTEKDLKEIDKKVQAAIALNIEKGHIKPGEEKEHIEALRNNFADNIAKKYLTKEEKEIGKNIQNRRYDAFKKSQDPVNAWDWAAKKLGYKGKVRDDLKEAWVYDAGKNFWPGSSMFAHALSAVKLHIENEQTKKKKK